MRFLRSLAAVLAGFGIFFAAMRWLPVQSFLAILGVTIAAALVAGFVTALIAGIFEFAHAAMVGMLVIGLAFVSMAQQGLRQPGQYQIAMAGCGPVSALLGAGFRVLMKHKRIRRARPASGSRSPESPSSL